MVFFFTYTQVKTNDQNLGFSCAIAFCLVSLCFSLTDLTFIYESNKSKSRIYFENIWATNRHHRRCCVKLGEVTSVALQAAASLSTGTLSQTLDIAMSGWWPNTPHTGGIAASCPFPPISQAADEYQDRVMSGW